MKEFTNEIIRFGIQIGECCLGIVYAIVHGMDKLVYAGMTHLDKANKNLDQADGMSKTKTATR